MRNESYLILHISYLPGKTREQAFRIGNEMADTVTSQNPAPVRLKFEKVSSLSKSLDWC
jgi:hypothetical protein